MIQNGDVITTAGKPRRPDLPDPPVRFVTSSAKAPVLYDAAHSFVAPGGHRLVCLEVGMYDYDRNVFEVPTQHAAAIRANHPADWAVIDHVGYELTDRPARLTEEDKQRRLAAWRAVPGRTAG